MICKINGVEHEVPSDVSRISLGRFVEFYTQYGKTLDEELTAIMEKEQDKEETEIDLQMHLDKEALSWYTFFTGYDFLHSNDVELTDILLQYRILRALIKDSENAAREFPQEIEWEGEIWAIQDYRITPGSLMSFNEIITGKEVVRQINKIGQGKWDALAYLCCIYFRKKGEPYVDDLLETRLELMNTLPLNIALSVAFFLNSSISIFRKNLASLVKDQEAKI